MLGFLAMIGLRTSAVLPEGVLEGAQWLTTVLLAAALFGLGSTVRVRELLRTGRRALVLGALATVLVGVAGYLLLVPAPG